MTTAAVGLEIVLDLLLLVAFIELSFIEVGVALATDDDDVNPAVVVVLLSAPAGTPFFEVVTAASLTPVDLACDDADDADDDGFLSPFSSRSICLQVLA